MKRTKAIRLVLLGGGVAAMLASCGERRDLAQACIEAKAQMRPDAEEICRRSASNTARGGAYAGSWLRGRSGGSDVRARTSSSTSRATAPSTSSRGGFGSTSRSFSS